MGPVRGATKKRRKIEKQINGDTVAEQAPEEQADCWDSLSRPVNGPVTEEHGQKKMASVSKVSTKTFDYICSLVKDDLMAKQSSFTFIDGRMLSVKDQVAVALRRLSSGESLFTVGEYFGVNQSTVSQVTWRFVEAMEERGLHHLRWPNLEELKVVKAKFEKIRGLPNCCGAIDTTHIVMSLPSVEASKVWHDREENYSMVLQAIVDSDMRFRDIVTGWPGSVYDNKLLKISGFYKLCEKGKRLNGEKMELPGGFHVGEYIVGDVGFPLLSWLITPYAGKGISDSSSEFNRRHYATRMVAQRALARLKEMWKIVQGVMWRPDKHKLPRIVLVCCLLHNIIIDMEDEVQDELPLSHLHDTGYRQQYCQTVDKNAFILRDKLSQYLSYDLPT